MTGEQRRAVWGLCLIIAATFLAGASLTFMLEPMMADLGLTSDQGDLVLSVTGIASLLTVFVAGRLGDRLGHRRVIAAGAIPFVVGSVVVAISQQAITVLLGLVLVAGSATAIQIVALGLLQQLFPEGGARVTAFTSFGMMLPAVWLVMPIVTGSIVGAESWRVVPSTWAVAGLLIPLLAPLLGRPEPRQPVGEYATPVLAGLALASAAALVNRASEDGWLSWSTVPPLVVGAVALVALVVLLRRLKEPSLSLAPLRIPHLNTLLLAVMIVACVDTLVYVTLAVQYLHALTSLQAAWAMVPAQLGAVLGAKALAGRLMRRIGSSRAGLVTLAGFAASMMSLLLVRDTSSLWVPIAAATAFSAMGSAAITVLNTEVMALAPEGEQGAISAYRGAASALGASLSVVALGSTIVSEVQQQSVSGTIDTSALVSGLHTDALVGTLLALVASLAYAQAARGRGRVPAR